MPDLPIGNKILEYEKQINNLKNTLAQRDEYVKSLSDKNALLENEKASLLSQVAQKDTIINQCQTENNQIKSSYEEKLAQNADTIKTREQEIKGLKTKIDELAKNSNIGQALISEAETLRIKYDSLSREMAVRDQNLIEIRGENNSLKFKYDELKKENDSLRELYLKEQQEKNICLQKLAVLNQKLQASFTASQMSNYLTNTIDSFNKQVNTFDSSINYVINEMDVEFKASLSKNDNNEMVLSAPDLGTDAKEAISSLKFSIRAVPK